MQPIPRSEAEKPNAQQSGMAVALNPVSSPVVRRNERSRTSIRRAWYDGDPQTLPFPQKPGRIAYLTGRGANVLILQGITYLYKGPAATGLAQNAGDSPHTAAISSALQAVFFDSNVHVIARDSPQFTALQQKPGFDTAGTSKSGWDGKYFMENDDNIWVLIDTKTCQDVVKIGKTIIHELNHAWNADNENLDACNAGAKYEHDPRITVASDASRQVETFKREFRAYYLAADYPHQKAAFSEEWDAVRFGHPVEEAATRGQGRAHDALTGAERKRVAILIASHLLTDKIYAPIVRHGFRSGPGLHAPFGASGIQIQEFVEEFVATGAFDGIIAPIPFSMALGGGAYVASGLTKL